MDATVCKSIAEDLLASLPRETSARRAYVYGSCARGEAQPYSDLDILVELESPVTPQLKSAIRDRAWERSLDMGILVSVMIVEEEEFEHGHLAESGFAQNVRSEGIEVAA